MTRRNWITKTYPKKHNVTDSASLSINHPRLLLCEIKHVLRILLDNDTYETALKELNDKNFPVVRVEIPNQSDFYQLNGMNFWHDGKQYMVVIFDHEIGYASAEFAYAFIHNNLSTETVDN